MRGGFILVFLSLFLGFQSLAQDRLTYEGLVEDQFGVPLNGFQSLTFKIRSSGSESCVFYTETKSLNVDNGFFKAVLNDGSGSVNFGSNLTQFSEIFIPATRVFNSVDCVTGTTTPANTGRTLEVIIGAESLGVIELTSAPYALQSRMIGASTEQSLLRATPGQTAPVLSAANLSVLTSLFNGTLTVNEAVTCQNVSGVIPIANGGTGANSEAVARNNLGLGPLATLSLPGDSAQILRGDGTWGVPSGGGGGVASVAGTSQEIVVNNADPTNPVVGLANLATSPAGTYGSSTQAVNLTIDSKGRVTSASNVTLDLSPTGKPLALNRVWIGDGGGAANPRFFGLADLRKSDSTPQIPASCSGGESLNYSSVLDVLECVPTSVNAANLIGTLPVSQGGTGAMDATAARASLGAMADIPVPSEDSLIGKQGAVWGARTINSFPVQLETTGSLTLYANPSGNDSCNGKSPSLGAPPSDCAIQSIEQALRLVPRLIRHPVTIQLSGGTFSPTASRGAGYRDAFLLIDKEIHHQSGGFLELIGAGAGTTMINQAFDWETGIHISGSARGVGLKRLTIQNFKTGLDVDGIALLGVDVGNEVQIFGGSTANSRGISISRSGEVQAGYLSVALVQKTGIEVTGGSFRAENGALSLSLHIGAPAPTDGASALWASEGASIEITGSLGIGMGVGTVSKNGLRFEDHSKGYINPTSFTIDGNYSTNSVGISVSKSNLKIGSRVQPMNGVLPTFLRCSEGSFCETFNVWSASGNYFTFFEISENSSLRVRQTIAGSMTAIRYLDLRDHSNAIFDVAPNGGLDLGSSSGGIIFSVANHSNLTFKQDSIIHSYTSSGINNKGLQISDNSKVRIESDAHFLLGSGDNKTALEMTRGSHLVLGPNINMLRLRAGSSLGSRAIQMNHGSTLTSEKEFGSQTIEVEGASGVPTVLARGNSLIQLVSPTWSSLTFTVFSGSSPPIKMEYGSIYLGPTTPSCAKDSTSACNPSPAAM